MIKTIDATTLKSLPANEVFIVDVREKEEFDAGHISGASLMQSLNFNANEVLSILPRKKKLVFYCRSGKRSMSVCNQLEEINDEEFVFYNLEGGIEAYNAA